MFLAPFKKSTNLRPYLRSLSKFIWNWRLKYFTICQNIWEKTQNFYYWEYLNIVSYLKEHTQVRMCGLPRLLLSERSMSIFSRALIPFMIDKKVEKMRWNVTECNIQDYFLVMIEELYYLQMKIELNHVRQPFTLILSSSIHNVQTFLV